MVADPKDVARKAFGVRFNAELDRIGIPAGRPRVSAVFRALKKDQKPLVSREQVRKWVRGVDIPDQANLELVVERLRIDWTRLQAGAAKRPTSPLLPRLMAAWNALQSDDARQQAVVYLEYLGAKDGTATKARPEGIDDDSEGDRAELQRHRSA